MATNIAASSNVQVTDAFRAGWKAHPVLAGSGILMLILFPLAIAGIFLDPKTITGAPGWLKPAKFAISIAAYTLTLAACLSLQPGRKWLTRIVAGGVALTLLVEIAAIGLQAARGVPSHFNEATSFDALVFRTMGTMIIVTWLLTIVVAIAVVWQREFSGPLVTAVRWGLAGAVIGMALAIPMVIPSLQQIPDLTTVHFAGEQEGHAVAAAENGPGLPIVGWSTVGGDLRIGHGVGMHALQIIPLFALLLIRYAPSWLNSQKQSRIVSVFGAFWIGLALLLTWQAMRAQSLVRPDGLTLGSLALLVVISIAGMALVARPPRPGAPAMAVQHESRRPESRIGA